MQRGLTTAVAAGLSLVSLLWAGQALANTTVIGGGFAEDCSRSAKAVSVNQPAAHEAVHLCTLALETEVLDPHDLASTYVNRGVLHLAMGEYADALKDFDAAIVIQPQLGEAFVNRGAALIGQGAVEIGLLRLGGLERQAAVDLGDAELKPGWVMAQSELARFTVVVR